MYFITRENMRREVRVMSMDGLAKFGATEKGSIPDLLEPELLTFCSDRGMMVCGSEEITGGATTRAGGYDGGTNHRFSTLRYKS